jgi:hypothetical protein
MQISGQLSPALPIYEQSRELYEHLGNERGVSHLTQRLAATEMALGHWDRGRALGSAWLWRGPTARSWTRQRPWAASEWSRITRATTT